MIHLHTLGDALITVGEREIRPSSPMVFAALLYLGVERGRRVPRAALQELLFPESDERSGSHSVRQLLYKLRQLGASIEADDRSIGLLDEIHDDLSESSLTAATTTLLKAGFLPSYTPHISAVFCNWLEATRDQQTVRIVRVLAKRLSRDFDTNRVDDALEACSAVLKHDPLNEDATLIRAKILAVTGQRQKAVKLLGEYAADVASEIRLPAEALSRRIQHQHGRPELEALLVGREQELASILAQHARAVSGVPAISIVWGEPGIGKSRLAQEIAERVRLDGTRVVWSHCQQRAIGHPLGTLTDLVHTLLKCPGSLGVAPESMAWLHRLVGRTGRTDNDFHIPVAETSRFVKQAIQDLIGSVAAEAPLLLIVEDVHWMDDSSRDFLLQLPADTRVHLLMTCRQANSAKDIPSEMKAVSVRKLEALPVPDSMKLFDAFLPLAMTVAATVRQTCVELANGNPLFIRTLVQHLSATGGVPASDAGIASLMLQRIHTLQPTSLLLLRMISVLGTLSTNARLRMCLSMDTHAFLLALQDLSQGGFVILQDGRITSVHQILTDTTIRSTPEPLRAQLFVAAASQLEQEGRTGREASLLWACANFWRLGGQPERAAAALRECAGYAVELGQLRYAIPALERARDLCSSTTLAELLPLTIRIADLATDDDAVIRNVDLWRQAAAAGVVSTEALSSVDLAEIRALRRLGKDIWSKRQILLREALALDMPIAHRRRAVRTFVISAEEGFGGVEAITHLPSLAHLWQDQSDLDAIELAMLVNLVLLDVQEAVVAADTLWSRIEECPVLAQPVTLSAVARTLCAAGRMEDSIVVSHRELELARRLGDAGHTGMAQARLADTYLALGDLSTARKWVAETRQFGAATAIDRTYHLYNSVTLAIAERDFLLARSELHALRDQDESRKKNAERSIVGMALLLENACGGIANAPFDEEELRRIDEAAWRHSEHLLFAIGLCLLLGARGFVREAQERLRQYFGQRRREYYDPKPFLSLMHLEPRQLRVVLTALTESRKPSQVSNPNANSLIVASP